MSRRVLSVMHASECYTSKGIHSRHGKVYIKIFNLVSTQHVYKSHSSVLTIHGLTGWNHNKKHYSEDASFFLNLPNSECVHCWFSTYIYFVMYMGRIEMLHTVILSLPHMLTRSNWVIWSWTTMLEIKWSDCLVINMILKLTWLLSPQTGNWFIHNLAASC